MIMTVGNWKLFSGSIRKFPFKFLIYYRFTEFWGQSFNGREFPHQVISITLCQENQSQKNLKPKVIYWTFARYLQEKYFLKLKFLDARIQDVSMSISIKVRKQKNLNDLTERCESDESDKHL